MADRPTLRFACQTYSWQLSLERYRGRYEHMVATAAAAGFTGFEPEVVMLGPGWSARGLGASLERHHLELAALVLALPWRGAEEGPDEREEADRAIAAVAELAGGRLLLVPLPREARPEPQSLREAQRRTMTCMTAVARRAASRGVRCTFHPNSPAGSLFRTKEDYAVMAELLPPLIGYTPDVGHIARGGMDPVTVIREWRDRVDHVHIKDLHQGGRWAPTGQGAVDIPAVLQLLAEERFPGWVTMEDESTEAGSDPDAAVLANGAYVRRHQQPVTA